MALVAELLRLLSNSEADHRLLRRLTREEMLNHLHGVVKVGTIQRSAWRVT